MRNLFLVILSFVSVQAYAAGELPEARFSIGTTTINPSSFNAEMATDGLTDMKSVFKLDIEVTYPLLESLNLGLRFEKNVGSTSSISSQSDPYNQKGATLYQDVIQVIARIPIVKNSFFRFDVMGAYGGSNTKVDITSASQTGTLSHTDISQWSSGAVTTFGASAGVGAKGYFFYVEGGENIDKCSSFNRSGNLNSNIQTIDLSGPYVAIGLIIDGTAIKKK